MQASDYTIWIMLTISLSAKVLRISFARKDEAAGNSEPPQGLPASKPVGGSGLSAGKVRCRTPWEPQCV